MAVTLNVASVTLGTSSAPLIEGTGSTTYGSAQGGVGFSNSSGFTGRRGCRIALAATTDFSTRSHIGFGLATTSFNLQNSLATIANGGIRVVFVDTSGNYAGYNVFGSGIPDYLDNNTGRANGFFTSFVTVASGADRPVSWQIDRDATPAISAGTINWSQIVAVELTVNATSSVAANLYLGELRSLGDFTVTGTESIASVFSFVLNNDGTIGDRQHWVSNSFISQSPPQIIYSAKMGLSIGNGSTTTAFTLSNAALGFFNTFDKSPTFRSVGPLILLSSSNTRQLLINQSATDTLSLTDGSIASAAWWQWVLQGSGTATCTRMQFWRFNGFTAAHGTYTDCQWNAGEAPVSVTTATVITRGVVRDATAGGLQITSGPGIYSALDVDFSNNTTFDVAMGSGGAGTYELVNVGVVGTYTLKIRNNSATNAITVAIPAGIAFTTSTAGGSITVSTPATYQSVTVNGLVSGSRLQIFDTTSSTELANVITGTSYTWTDPNPAVSSRAIRVRIAYVSGTTAKQFIEANIGTTGTSGSNAAVTYLANQVDDPVYIANGINGSTVTGITITDSIDRMVINIAGGSVSWPQIYAYNVFWLHTSAGIVDDGAIITAVDTANYRVTGFKIRNSNATPLSITGGYGVDTATGSVASLIDQAGSTGNIYQTPDVVIAYATGSGLSPSESAQLFSLNTANLDVAVSTRLAAASYTAPTTPPSASSIASAILSAAQTTPIHADTKKMNGADIIGTGAVGDSWRGSGVSP